MLLPVHDFLSQKKGAIIAAWEREVRAKVPADARVPTPALIDHVPEIIDRLADEMRRDGTPRAGTIRGVSQRHADSRAAQDVPLARAIDEYRILRSTIVAMLAEERAAARDAVDVPTMMQRADDVARLNALLDESIADFVREYGAARDRRLATAEQRLRLALQSAAIGTWDLEVRSGLFTLDARCREVFGLPPDLEGAYQRFIAAVHPDDRDRVARAARSALSGEGGGEYRADYRIIRASDHEIRWVASRGSALFDESGRATRFIGTLVDVTDVKLAEQVRERFIAILGHDLRTPLGTISMAANYMLRAGPLPAGVDRSAALVARAADRMSRMIHDLLDLASARLHGGMSVAPRPVDLGEISGAVVDEMQVLHPTRAIALETEGDLRGCWDSDRLAQAVSNLLSNAVVHGRDPISVSVRGVDDAVVIEVTNAGPAIPEHDRALLFDPFRRARTPKPGSSGLGLGLFIVSQVAAAHGGTVDVRSDESGTTFALRLPRGVSR